MLQCSKKTAFLAHSKFIAIHLCRTVTFREIISGHSALAVVPEKNQ